MAAKYNENNKKDLAVEAQIKTILNTIFENCKREGEQQSLKVPLSDVVDRVAYYTGLEKESLCNILDDKPIKNMTQTYDLKHRMIIMKALLSFYKNRESPSFHEVYEKVKGIFPVEDIVQFRYAMTKIGFDYRKTINGLMITEDAKLTFERIHYLKKIKKLRASKVPICYLEERYIDKHFKFNKPDLEKDGCLGNNTSTHIWDGFYLYHVLSDTGLDYYFITNKICKLEYRKWVINILLKILKPGCAIVIDNHPFHGELENDTVTPFHSKADMMSWLRKRNIPCSDSMCKAELYEIICNCHQPKPGYDFDRLLKAHGHDVLRLPTGFKELSPIPLLWTEVSKRMPRLNIGCTAVELEEAIIPTIVETHTATWNQMKPSILKCEETVENLYSETETALEMCEPFDVKNVDSYANFPKYFYELY